jgi:hypothetical protein
VIFEWFVKTDEGVVWTDPIEELHTKLKTHINMIKDYKLDITDMKQDAGQQQVADLVIQSGVVLHEQEQQAGDQQQVNVLQLGVCGVQRDNLQHKENPHKSTIFLPLSSWELPCHCRKSPWWFGGPFWTEFISSEVMFFLEMNRELTIRCMQFKVYLGI